jgi:hypothetical protein
MALGYAAHISVRCIFVLESGNFSFFTGLTHSSAVFRVVYEVVPPPPHVLWSVFSDAGFPSIEVGESFPGDLSGRPKTKFM